MTAAPSSVNGVRHARIDDRPSVEEAEYRGRLAVAIEAARADLAERAAATTTVHGRVLFARPDETDDRMVAGDAAGRELAAITRDRLTTGLPPLASVVEDRLRTRALQDALGRVGILEPYLTDARLEEVVVNRAGRAFAWWADGTKTAEGRLFDSDAEVIALAQRVVRQQGHGGQRLDTKTPMVRVDLPGGDRFVAVLGGERAGGVASGPLLSLRRKRLTAPTLDQLVTLDMLPTGAAAQGRVLTRTGVGTLVSGGMGSGKTTLLAALLADRNADERVATFERDVMELNLAAVDESADVVEFYTRSGNTEGVGEVDLGALIARARQLRIDRNVVGELVHGPDAWEMLNASSGATYRSIATLHADDPGIVLDRLAIYCAAHPTRPPVDQINRFIAQTVDVIWFCELFEHAGRRTRRVTAIREVGGVTDTGAVASSDIWTYDPTLDQLIQRRAWSPGLLERVRRRGLPIDTLLPDQTDGGGLR